MSNVDELLKAMTVIALFLAPVAALAYGEIADRTDLPCPAILRPEPLFRFMIAAMLTTSFTIMTMIMRVAKLKTDGEVALVETLNLLIAASIAMAAAFVAEAAGRRRRLKAELSALLEGDAGLMASLRGRTTFEISRNWNGSYATNIALEPSLALKAAEIHHRHAHRMPLPVTIGIGPRQGADGAP